MIVAGVAESLSTAVASSTPRGIVLIYFLCERKKCLRFLEQVFMFLSRGGGRWCAALSEGGLW